MVTLVQKGETGNLAHDVVTVKAEDLKASVSWGVRETGASEPLSLLLGSDQTTIAVSVCLHRKQLH